MSTLEVKLNLKNLEERTREARNKGALFHVTNPADSYMCACGVFGRGDTECWACGNTDLQWQYIPRWGGGAQRVGDDL